MRARQWWKYGLAAPYDATFRVDPALGLRVPDPERLPRSVRVDSRGFRNPELRSPKPPGTVRLAFLGASTTYGAEVSDNEATWPHLVWRRVQEAAPAVEFDYINAAVPGYTVDASLKTLRRRVAPLRPDVVVITEGLNDLSADTAALARRRGLPELRPEESWLSRYSLLWLLVEKNVHIRRLQGHVNDPAGKLTPVDGELSREFEGRLTELVAAGQEIAAVVAVATLSPRLRRTLAADDRPRAAITAVYYVPFLTLDGILDAYDEYNRVIRRVAERRQALLIPVEDSIPADDRHYTDSVHFTDAGSRVMAERVSGTLLAAPAFQALLAAHRRRPAAAQRISAFAAAPWAERPTRACSSQPSS